MLLPNIDIFPLASPHQLPSLTESMDLEAALLFVDTLVFTKTGKHLSDLQRAVFRASWPLHHQSYDEIANAYGYSANYLKQDVGPKLWKLLSEVLGEKVSKNNFQGVLERQSHSYLLNTQQKPPRHLHVVKAEDRTTACQDWGEAVDVSVFYGRKEELATLEQWIIKERCRLVALLGMGGIGKTALCVRLCQQLQEQFEFVVWRSLSHAPTIKELLTNLLQFLNKGQPTDLPEDIASQVSRLIHHLRTHRCLIVLEGAETILKSGDCVGHYIEGYEGYGELLKQLGATPHQSAIVLTSREKPKEIALLEGETLPVRALQLCGLKAEAGQEVLKARGSLYGSELEWRKIVELYAGNPLALQIVSTEIQELFDGNISEFLEHGAVVFDQLIELLDQHFNRLSDLEKTVLQWLALSPKPVRLAQLHSAIAPPVSKRELLEAVKSLLRRSLIEKATPKLIEKHAACFSLQPMVIEYVTELC